MYKNHCLCQKSNESNWMYNKCCDFYISQNVYGDFIFLLQYKRKKYRIEIITNDMDYHVLINQTRYIYNKKPLFELETDIVIEDFNFDNVRNIIIKLIKNSIFC